MNAETLADHPAGRNANPMHLVQGERIHDGDGIRHKLRKRIRAGRCIGIAVPAPVIAQQPVAVFERRHLPVPNPMAGPHRVRHHNGRSVRIAVPTISEFDSRRFDFLNTHFGLRVAHHHLAGVFAGQHVMEGGWRLLESVDQIVDRLDLAARQSAIIRSRAKAHFSGYE